MEKRIIIAPPPVGRSHQFLDVMIGFRRSLLNYLIVVVGGDNGFTMPTSLLNPTYRPWQRVGMIRRPVGLNFNPNGLNYRVFQGQLSL